MSESKNEIVRRLQRELVGKRFEGATLSKIHLGDANGKKIVEWVEKPSNILLFTGSPGVGKTYFCAALLEWIFGRFSSFRYWNERDLLQRVRNTISSGLQGDYIKELGYILDDHFLIIDDMGSCGLNDWRREVWLEIIDTRYESQLPTVITSNLSNQKIKIELGDRSHSRLMSTENIFIDLHGSQDLRQVNNDK